ncbi:MAG: protein-glutamate methylesterase/protein-glutamine glutaminase [Oceanococcus sp.]
MSSIKVLVVDDSALVRQLLTELLSSDPAIEVVGSAADPFMARDKIKQLNPDVLTLDVEMPRMDGLKFLENIMRLRPMPVVMVSSLTQKGAQTTLSALELGAVDFVAKPTLGVAEGLQASADELIEKVKIAAVSKPQQRSDRLPEQRQTPAAGRIKYETTDRLVAIGASTGGTEAVRVVLSHLSADSPGIVIAQHIPEAFSASFAERLDGASAIAVCEAENGQEIRPGHAYVAPGDDHLQVVRSGARWKCQLSKSEPVNRHRPSVDVLFDSVAKNCGNNACGILLTGMGDDGARGLKSMRDEGAFTAVQDEATSVVWGMPGAAWKLDAACCQLRLSDVASAIEKFARKGSRHCIAGR